MRATDRITRPAGYVLTERGRLDLHCAERCNCNPRLAGLLIECPECGTIYGTLREAWEYSGPSDRKRD